MKRSKNSFLKFKSYYGILTLIVFVILILLNILASLIDFRFDFTADKRYTLTESTINFLEDDEKLTDRILFKVYLDGDLPAEINKLRSAVLNKLKEFKHYAGDRIQYEFIDPDEGNLEDQQALKDLLWDKNRGIRPVQIMYKSNGNTSLREIFPGITVEYLGNTVGTIRLIEGGKYELNYQLEEIIQKSIGNIEYNLMRMITKASRKSKQRIAFIHGHGELIEQQTQGARKNIEDSYDIFDVTINGQLNALDEIEGIIIADPQYPISDKDKFIIDQYLMKGGNVMLFYNPLYVDNDSIRKRGQISSIRKRTGINRLLFDYGLKINEDLVADSKYDPFIFPGMPKGYVNWYYYVRAEGQHPISNMVDPVKLPYASSLQFVQTTNNVKPSIILTSSSNSISMGNAPLVSIAIERSYGENPIFQENIEDPNNRIMLGAILEGEFNSAFKNRIVKEYLDNPNSTFHEKSTAAGKLMVVSNGTFMKNTFFDSVFVTQEGKYRYLPRYPKGYEIDELFCGTKIGNFDFFENSVDYMMGENTLLSIRSRIIDLHPLNKLKIEKESKFYKLINIFVPLLFLFILYFILTLLRKKSFTKNS